MTDSSNMGGVSNELNSPFHFEPGTQPIPSELRTLRRLALLTLTISFCYGGNATLSQIHVLNWAIRSRESRETFQQFHAGWIPPDAAVVRLDPTLARTLAYAVAEQLVTDRIIDPDERGAKPSKSYRVTLTEKGRALNKFAADFGMLADERLFLEGFDKKITQRLVDSLLEWS